MPQVGNKKFPYTPSGIRQAKQAYDRKRNPLASAMAGMKRQQRFGSAINQIKGQSRLAAAQSNMRNQGLVNQLKDRVASPQPNRRQAIASQIGQDKVYRPDRDGPKRVAQTPPRPVGTRLPRPSGIRLPKPSRGVASMRLPGRKPRPGRGAIAPRPWRPKPPNRKYL